MRPSLIAILFACYIVSCSPSTKIVKSWREPEASVTRNAENKTLVIAMVKDESSRHIIEDQLVKRLNNNAVASYSIITSDLLKEANEATLSEKLKQGNFTHVLMMRLAQLEKETSYVPGTNTGFYGGYGRYYGNGAGMYSTPGYYTTDKNYFVETTVYTVSPNKLIWAGTTKTVNPSSMDKAVNEIADVVSNKMKADGFLK
ncbi:MAG: hypothetical protein H7320_14930 [Ferruginibacter sp.]|nr:hypothetical protein [Ferruginibacter sp.]